jgi:hypothetical protein
MPSNQLMIARLIPKGKQKYTIKAHGWNHHTEDKKGRPKKGQKRYTASRNQRREIPAKPLRNRVPTPPPVEAHVQLLPQARGAYFRNILFHRLYLNATTN